LRTPYHHDVVSLLLFGIRGLVAVRLSGDHVGGSIATFAVAVTAGPVGNSKLSFNVTVPVVTMFPVNVIATGIETVPLSPTLTCVPFGRLHPITAYPLGAHDATQVAAGNEICFSVKVYVTVRAVAP